MWKISFDVIWAFYMKYWKKFKTHKNNTSLDDTFDISQEKFQTHMKNSKPIWNTS